MRGQESPSPTALVGCSAHAQRPALSPWWLVWGRVQRVPGAELSRSSLTLGIFCH